MLELCRQELYFSELYLSKERLEVTETNPMCMTPKPKK
jgi:hypothetical protein